MLSSSSIKISTPFLFVIFGPSGTGKTTLLKKLLVNSDEVFDKPINRLIFVYGGAEQKLYDEIRQAVPNSTFIEGWDEAILDNKDLYTGTGDGVQTALVVDDAVFQCGNSKFLVDCYVKHRSRWNLNVILLAQVIFQPDLKGLRTISRNATGMFLMRNHRSRQSIKILASQMGIDNVKVFMKMFESATEEFGYLYCSMSGWLEDEIMRYRSGILPGERSTCYEFTL